MIDLFVEEDTTSGLMNPSSLIKRDDNYGGCKLLSAIYTGLITENYYSMMVLSADETLRMETRNLRVLMNHG
jgi:hypothetical protein